MVVPMNGCTACTKVPRSWAIAVQRSAIEGPTMGNDPIHAGGSGKPRSIQLFTICTRDSALSARPMAANAIGTSSANAIAVVMRLAASVGLSPIRVRTRRYSGQVVNVRIAAQRIAEKNGRSTRTQATASAARAAGQT